MKQLTTEQSALREFLEMLTRRANDPEDYDVLPSPSQPGDVVLVVGVRAGEGQHPLMSPAYIVASVNLLVRDWAMYIGGTSPVQTAAWGDKLLEDEARVFFPGFPRELVYRD